MFYECVYVVSAQLEELLNNKVLGERVIERLILKNIPEQHKIMKLVIKYLDIKEHTSLSIILDIIKQKQVQLPMIYIFRNLTTPEMNEVCNHLQGRRQYLTQLVR